MDRFLIAGAALLLVLEVAFLVTDFDESSTRSNSFTRQERSIGKLVTKTNVVQRRGANTLIWDETQALDPLYAFDSVLTLTGSSARLELEGETVLALDQDTLVVLEPSGESSDGRLKIRFQKGTMRTRNARQPLEISGEETRISTEPGSSLHLANLDDGRLHVEVEAGEAKLESSAGTETLRRGERVLIDQGAIEEKTKTVSEMKLSSEIPKRLYVESFPHEFEVKWTGDAKSLEILDAKRVLSSIAVDGHAKSVKLGEGRHRLWLAAGGGSSESVEIEVLRRPPLRPYAPLARDRVVTGKEIVFAWESGRTLAKFKLETSRSETFDSIEETFEVTEPRVAAKGRESGTFYWRVTATDDLGVMLPPSKPSSYVVVPLKLEAPTLNAPEIREPADEESSIDGAMNIFDLFIPEAHAQFKKVDAILSWQPMANAEYYVIEISQSPGFESTLVSKKIKDPKFVYRGERGARVYWRVAAGVGEITGPFSAAAPLKLEGAKPVAREETAPSATVGVPTATVDSAADVTKAVVAKTTPTPAPQPTPAPVTAAVVTPVAQMTPPIDEPVVSFAERSNRKAGRLFYSPKYRSTTSSNELDVKGSFAGVVALSFGADLYLFETPRGRVEVALAYEESQWKPKSSPRQTDVKEQRGSIAIAYRSNTSRWSFALAAETLPLLARKASEEAELRPQTLFGADARFADRWLGGMGELAVELRTGGEFAYGARLKSGVDYRLGSSAWFLGPDLCIETFGGSSNKGLTSAVGGVHVGAGW